MKYVTFENWMFKSVVNTIVNVIIPYPDRWGRLRTAQPLPEFRHLYRWDQHLQLFPPARVWRDTVREEHW